jgi:peptide-methionine (R)-S-oxide reductase
MPFTRREIGLGAVAVAVIGAAAIGYRLIGARNPAVAGTFEVTHTPEEWRKLLSPAQYAVLREQDTERAFTSPLNDEHRTGTFICAGCDLPLAELL